MVGELGFGGGEVGGERFVAEDGRDRRTRQGKRDLALLHLLGSAGLRRAEAANLLLADVDERRRSSDPRLRQAITGSTSWWVTVRYGKRGRADVVPLDDALDDVPGHVVNG